MTSKISEKMPVESLDRYLFKRSPGKLSTHINGQSVIMDLQSGTYLSMNPVGSKIWEVIEGPTGFSKILAAILEKFEVDKSRAEEDLRVFLDKLLTKQLIIASKASAEE
jgi:hypothetical protein